MSRRPGKFDPGWKMTTAQHSAYFNLLDNVYRARGITKTSDKEAMRKQVHQQAFGRPTSAKDIDHMRMFDEFKAVCLAMSQPENLEAQIHQVNQPLIRLRHAIGQFPEAYIVGLLRSPRFKRKSLADLDDMGERELTDLRNTLCARAPKRSDQPEESDLAGAAEAEPAPVEEGMPF